MMKQLAKKVLKPLLVRMRPGNVVVFHIGRCGSTVLGQLLGQHPRIHWASELYAYVFAEWERKNGGVEKVGGMPEDAVRMLRRDMETAFHRFYGVEMKPFHFRLVGYPQDEMLKELDNLGFTHYIILDRRNRLRKVVSSIIAHKKAKYHKSRGDKTELSSVYIDVSDVRIDFDQKPLIAYLRDYDEQLSSLEAGLKDRKLLKLTYEDDIEEDPLKAYTRVCGFLGLEPEEDVSVKLSRTNPFPLREMIENIEEVEDLLKGTAYAWMLDN